MKNYFEDLQNSFPGLDKVKNLPIFADGIKELQHQLDHLHDIRQATVNVNPNNSSKKVTSNNVATVPTVPTVPTTPSLAPEAPKTE